MPKLPRRETVETVDDEVDTAMSADVPVTPKEVAPTFRDQVISKIREEDPSIPVEALQKAFAAGAYETRRANTDQFIVARVLARQALEDDGAERCMITLQIASIRTADDSNPVLSKPIYVFVPTGQWRRYPVARQFMVQLVPIAETPTVNVPITPEPTGTEN